MKKTKFAEPKYPLPREIYIDVDSGSRPQAWLKKLEQRMNDLSNSQLIVGTLSLLREGHSFGLSDFNKRSAIYRLQEFDVRGSPGTTVGSYGEQGG